MTDPASQFLSRKERKAILKKLKRGETAQAMVPCIHDGRHGLLCSTRTRVMFSARKGMSTKVWTWGRGSIRGVAHVKKRYGGVAIKTDKHTLRFDMTRRGDAKQFLASLAPPRDKAASAPAVEFQQRTGANMDAKGARGTATTRPAPRPKAAATRPVRPKPAPEPEPDALAHRDSAEHRARLERMLERGIITKREYEWQVESR